MLGTGAYMHELIYIVFRQTWQYGAGRFPQGDRPEAGELSFSDLVE